MKNNTNKWALIIGGSSGFGLATAVKFAKEGFSIYIIHRDRRSKMPEVEKTFHEISLISPSFKSINVNAVTEEGMEKAINDISKVCGEKSISTCMFSVADGNIRQLIGDLDQNSLWQNDLQHTIWSMGASFAIWVKKLMAAMLFADGASVTSITSEGVEKVLDEYAAVGSAKAVLETLSRYMAVELAPKNIRVNVINAGISDTPALHVLPNYRELIEKACLRNPSGRLTKPEDVANAIYLLSLPEAAWITGNVIRVDGGEQLKSI